jgi:hypothetical protein
MLRDVIIILSSVLMMLVISATISGEDNAKIVTFDEDKIYYDIVTYISTNFDVEGKLTEDEFNIKSSDLKREIISNFYTKIKEISKKDNIIFLKKDSAISNHHDQTNQIRDILYEVIMANKISHEK